MAAFTSQELFEIAGLRSDGASGFSAQVASGLTIEIDWPAHLRGGRVDEFRRGSRIARAWMASRRAVSVARRRARKADSDRTGGMRFCCPVGDELRAEQVEDLRRAAQSSPATVVTPASADQAPSSRSTSDGGREATRDVRRAT